MHDHSQTCLIRRFTSTLQGPVPLETRRRLAVCGSSSPSTPRVRRIARSTGPARGGHQRTSRFHLSVELSPTVCRLRRPQAFSSHSGDVGARLLPDPQASGASVRAGFTRRIGTSGGVSEPSRCSWRSGAGNQPCQSRSPVWALAACERSPPAPGRLPVIQKKETEERGLIVSLR